MGEGGISHRESPGKAREGAETAPKGGPRVPAQPSPGEERTGGQLEVPSIPHHYCLSVAPAAPPTPPSSTQKLPPTLCCAFNYMPSLSLGPDTSPGEAISSHTPLKMTQSLTPTQQPDSADHYPWAVTRRVPGARSWSPDDHGLLLDIC